MAKITAEQLEIAKGWQDFGDRLGWGLAQCAGDAMAVFNVKGMTAGDPSIQITIRAPIRRDIERTWRELEQSNVAPIRSGTDG